MNLTNDCEYSRVTLQIQAVALLDAHSEGYLVRKKRIWIPPPTKVWENKDYSGKEYIARVSHFLFFGFILFLFAFFN